MIAWGDGYLGIGSGRSWASKDGTTWTSAPLSGDVLAGEMVAVGNGLVAAGTGNDGRLAAAWTSGDGVTWTALERR